MAKSMTPSRRVEVLNELLLARMGREVKWCDGENLNAFIAALAKDTAAVNVERWEIGMILTPIIASLNEGLSAQVRVVVNGEQD